MGHAEEATYLRHDPGADQVTAPERCPREDAFGRRCNGTGGHFGECDCSPCGPAHTRWGTPASPPWSAPDRREPARVCDRLVEAGVSHAIVGGWAAVLHGVRRVPHDLDVAVRPWHLPRVDALVADLGYAYVGPLEVHDSGTPRERSCRKMLRDLGGGRHQMLDFVAAAGPFVGVVTGRHAIDGMWVASHADLIRMKRLAARPVDLEDLVTLERRR